MSKPNNIISRLGKSYANHVTELEAQNAAVREALAVIEFDPDSERYRDMGQCALTVFVNPVVTVLDDEEQAFWEGCLSVPDLRGVVPRPRKVRVDYVDLDGQPQSMVGEDFIATVLQHELDHLDGILFVDRVRDTRLLATVDEYEKHWLSAGDDEAAEG